MARAALRCTVVLAATLAAWPAASQDHAAAPGTLDGRPAPRAASPLQARVDGAPAGSTLRIPGGVYRGDLFIDKPLRLVGDGRPRLEGSGDGSVVRIRAADVRLEEFDIDGRGAGDLGRDTSGIHVAAPRAAIVNCRITRALFGVYLREAHGSSVRGTTIEGIPGLDPGEKGSGIHVWNTDGFTLVGNRIVEVRDGLYIQSSPHGRVVGNVASRVRYGLHYMFSDDNVFEDNLFEYADAGSAIMYSNRIQFRRNRFLHNRGFASVGLLFKTCDDIVAEDNLIADNARGIFLEGSNRNVFRRNVIAESDVAIVLYDSCAKVRFEGNSFVGNLSPLMLVGRRTDTVVAGNYWSDNAGIDLDGDGIADHPYRLSNVFDHLRGNLTAADLFAQGVAAAALGAAESTFPVLAAVTVEDPRPLARPPALPDVPAPERSTRSAQAAGVVVSLGLVAAGTASAARARRGLSARRPRA
jgi:nitrous oxidase accessory protein